MVIRVAYLLTLTPLVKGDEQERSVARVFRYMLDKCNSITHLTTWLQFTVVIVSTVDYLSTSLKLTVVIVSTVDSLSTSLKLTVVIVSTVDYLSTSPKLTVVTAKVCYDN